MSVGLQPQAEPVLVAPGQQQQVVGEPGQPLGFGAGAAHRGGQVVPAAAGTRRQLQLAAQHRQRGAQLVAGVGDEGPLPGQRPLQPAEQVVHRAGQGGDLIAGGRHLDGRDGASSRLGYRGHLPPQPLHRGQGGPRQPVGAQARDGDEDDPADRELPHHLALGGVVRLERTPPRP